MVTGLSIDNSKKIFFGRLIRVLWFLVGCVLVCWWWHVFGFGVGEGLIVWGGWFLWGGFGGVLRRA